jgi:hypothetical protein
MNYADNANATGLDSAIRNISKQLEQLPWLINIYGRAYSYKTEKGKVKPYTYKKDNEYDNVLPNDNFNAQCFFKAKGDEITNFDFPKGSRRTGLIQFERDISLIVWVNLQTIDYANKSDYNYTERLKEDVMKRLKSSQEVMKIKTYIDEDSKRVFDGYDLDDVQQHYLMMPYTGFRIDLTVKYSEKC